MDLLKGKGEWLSNKKATALTPGVQKPSKDWLAEVIKCEDEYALAAEISNSEALEPRTLSEAKTRPDWTLWEKVCEEELKTLKEAGMWEVVDAPKHANIVRSKWVFRAQKDMAGNVVRYKARLMAQDFSQVPRVDYFNMFAPVARLALIQTVLAFVVAKDYGTGQIDIKAVYLNGELTSDKIIFMRMRQPPGYEEESKGQVLQLLK